MKIFENIPENNNIFNNPVVTIGNFDGIHIGHKKIFNIVKAIAKQKAGDPIVITFSIHPRKILYPEIPCRILTTVHEKTKAIFESGISNIILLHFDKKMANMNAKDFYYEYLIKRLDVKDIVIGYDHAFGKNREGTIDFLMELSQKTGVGITRVEEEKIDTRPVSSTWLRSEVEDGNIPMANTILGRKYSITGRVVKGVGRGQHLGFPTANIMIDEPEKIIPADGVYAVSVLLDNHIKKQGMLNIGKNPTFSNDKKTIEVNIFDFNKDIYGEELIIKFHHRLRNETKFNTQEELIQQLHNDKLSVIKILSNE